MTVRPDGSHFNEREQPQMSPVVSDSKSSVPPQTQLKPRRCAQAVPAGTQLAEKVSTFLEDAPVFHQDWWLEAVQPAHWERVNVFKGGNLAASLPIVYTEGKKTRLIAGMPALTQVLGPWLRRSDAKAATRLAEEKDLMFELIHCLPPLKCFHQNFHYTITNWLPFYWKGFSETTQYTYVLENLQDLEKI